MKEKVLYVVLPDGAKYQRVMMAEDGKIGIVYIENCVSNENDTKGAKIVTENKPTPPIGGTAVFQIPENGTNYWYSKLKDRDLFMCLQFADITEQDLLFDASSDRQKKFKKDAYQAIKDKPAEGFRWIPAYEPSMGENGEIQYVPGKDALRGLAHDKWEKIFKEYSPENGSQEASKTTYFLLLMRWLKDGIATLEQIVDHSEEIGHFWDSENSKHTFEKTGERQFGGLYGFVGNTYKEVKDPESPSGFLALGGCYNIGGSEYPLADVCRSYDPYGAYNVSVGLLELTK